MTLGTLQPLIDWIAAHPDLSGLIVFLFAMGESLALVGIIVPGVVIMLSVGTLVGLGAINLWYALIFAALGAIAGDWFSYWLGRHFDQQLRHLWPLSRYPKLIPAGEKFFTRHGGKSVLFGRFVGPLRPVIPAVAGIMHMSQAKFYFMNIVSAILWAPVVILPGVAFGNSLQLAQEVFGKLIMLVVILVFAAALFGYIAKKLFAYALMTTVNTWGEFFGFDRARENLASFSLVGVLVVSIALFVSHHDYRYQVPVIVEHAVDSQWWEDNWQAFSPVLAQDKKFSGDYPITIQWWGSFENIKTRLEQHQWKRAERLTLQNSLHYFLSDPDPLKLPARKIKLFDSYEKLVMVKPASNGNQLSVLRIWPANKRQLVTEEQLWLGVIYNVNLLSPFDLFNYALRDNNLAQSVTQFKSDMASDSELHVRQKYYGDVSITDEWRGEVVLLSFKKNPEIKIADMGSIKLSRRSLDGAGPSLLAPATFKGSPESGFNYDNNGVSIDVRRLAMTGDGMSSFTQLRKELIRKLKNQPVLHLTSFSETLSGSTDLRTTHLAADYDMPPVGKQIAYQVKILERPPAVWVATAVVKQCDSRGKHLVNTIMNSME